MLVCKGEGLDQLSINTRNEKMNDCFLLLFFSSRTHAFLELRDRESPAPFLLPKVEPFPWCSKL